MEDFYYAGGLPAVLRELGRGTVAAPRRVDGQRPDHLGQRQPGRMLRRKVIFPLANPFKAKAGIAVLQGNLAPDGAVIKPSAATPRCCSIAGGQWCSRA